ncbi:hypothetical protein ACT8ZV_09540 [Nocardioides sp. MAHUQ-72]|uniref:hypothetical protein n=1 Tax=unclassified Nocardioides TaxID=2615069 RepID=UPI003611A190
MTVNAPGTTIDGLDVRGQIKIRADDVTIRDTRVTDGGWIVIDVAPGVTGTRVEDVEVNGRGQRGSPGSVGIAGTATIRNTEIRGVENGVIPGSGSVVRDSWIHGLDASGQEPHYDGIQLDGGQQHVRIEHNLIDLTNHDGTSTVMIDNDFGPVRDVVVRENRLLGGSYTVYADGKFSAADPIRGVRYVRNRMMRGAYGYGLVRNASVDWRANVDDDSGERAHAS